MTNAFGKANDVLSGSVQGIAELITRPGLINVDFADVQTVMRETGMAMVGTGKAEGEDRAREAAEAAINSPLLEDVNLKGARGILVNITAGEDMTIAEFEEVGTIVRGFAADDAVTIIGTCTDPAMPESIRVTIVATGLGERLIPDTGTRHRPEALNDVGLVSDYAELDRPTVMRQGAQTNETESTDIGQKTEDEVTQIQTEYLDIPAFLRRQAD
jgi:cell division protein FtsZ